MKTKDILIHGAIALVVAIVVSFGAVSLFQPDIPELTKGDTGEQGEQGLRGFTGVGSQGPVGKDGVGKDGKDAVVDIDAITSAVIDEIEDRDNQVTFAFSGEGGDYASEFDVADTDSYKFAIKHFGSGDFDASIEDEDGNVSTLIDTSGHLSFVDTRTLEEGTYTVRVSADGNWSVEIEEK